MTNRSGRDERSGRRGRWVVWAFVGFLIAAFTYTSYNRDRGTHSQPPNVTSKALQATVEAIEVQMYAAELRAREAAVTGTAEAVRATATAGASRLQAQSTLQAAQARRAARQADTRDRLQPVTAVSLLVLTLAAGGLLLYAVRRFVRVLEDRLRLVESETGILLVLKKDRTLQLDRTWGPTLDHNAAPSSAPTPAQQDEVTRRAQGVQAIRAARSGDQEHRRQSRADPRDIQQLLQHDDPHSARSHPDRIPGLRRVVRLRKLEHAQRSGLVPPKLVRAIEADWQQQVVEGEYREL